MMEEQFWVVWCENGGAPTVKHPTFADAKREANRLARNVPGNRFVVLAAAYACAKTDLVETRFGSVDDFRPF